MTDDKQESFTRDEIVAEINKWQCRLKRLYDSGEVRKPKKVSMVKPFCTHSGTSTKLTETMNKCWLCGKEWSK